MALAGGPGFGGAIGTLIEEFRPLSPRIANTMAAQFPAGSFGAAVLMRNSRSERGAICPSANGLRV
jgi:hypothetical protein